MIFTTGSKDFDESFNPTNMFGSLEDDEKKKKRSEEG